MISAAELPVSDPATLAPAKKYNPADSLPKGDKHPAKLDIRDPKAALNPRQSVLTAFGEVGGVRWLKKLAKKYPKDFVSLLAKAMPTDVNVTGTVGYVPMAIPVEERDAIPGEFTEVLRPALQVLEEPDPFT